MKEKRHFKTLEHFLGHWTGYVTNTASMHGLKWLESIQQRWLRAIFMLVVIVVMTILPYSITQILVDDLTNNPVKSPLYMNYSRQQMLPRLVLCNPLYFNTEKIKALGVAEDYINTFASFLTYSVDKKVALKIRESEKFKSAILEKIIQFDLELKRVMKMNNHTSLLSLFKAISIDCEDFLKICDNLNMFYPGKECCEKFFDGPVFTTIGVCYYYKSSVLSSDYGHLSQTLMYFDTEQDSSPTLDHTLVSNTVYSRRSIAYFLTYDDYVTEANIHKAQYLRMNYITYVPYELQEINSEKLQDDNSADMVNCMSGNRLKQFEENYPALSYSFALCSTLWLDYYRFDNCTLLPFVGIELGRPEVPLCSPFYLVYNSSSLRSLESIPIACFRDCVTTEVVTKSTFRGDLNKDLLLDFYANRTMNAAGLSIYLKDMERSVIVKQRTSFMTILSGIGGGLGLWLGASMISVLEMVIFMTALAFGLVRWTITWL